ncbi:hypothetical protein L4D06_05540 [Enterovibrio makurazakiensis]|uniref:hypothetical protein n=1 Tax=Enterovibrio makurazakiensis TaxID=2910232 RepID=UPI003D1C576F
MNKVNTEQLFSGCIMDEFAEIIELNAGSSDMNELVTATAEKTKEVTGCGEKTPDSSCSFEAHNPLENKRTQSVSIGLI